MTSSRIEQYQDEPLSTANIGSLRSRTRRALGMALIVATVTACSGARGPADSDAPNDVAVGVDVGERLPDVAALSDAAIDAIIDDSVSPITDASVPDADAARPTPVGFDGNYSSPTIVRVGNIYHAYFAAQNIHGRHYNTPHATFTDDGVWTFVGEALPHLGAQADEGPGAYPVWAPAVAQIDATHWMLYYTAHELGTTAQKCIWRAHASSPDGPFVDDYAGPIECPTAPLWAIDPYLVQDAHDVWHLAARIDQPGGINTIQIRALGPMAQDFAAASSWVEMTHNAPTSWEQPVLENAGVVRLTPPTAAPHWFVFYSGRAWDDNSYAVGYADCGTGIDDGACIKRTVDGPWLATDATAHVFAPGTPTFYTSTTGEMLMSVQAWQYTGGTSNPMNTGQIMRTYRITVDDAYVPTATLVRVDLH